jgi:Golgi phosphoprotein 3 (GPP34)
MHERRAASSAGHRYQDRPGGLEGTGLVADDLYLLAHDDRTGKPLLQPRALGTGLAAGLLAELLLTSQISLRRDNALVICCDVPYEVVSQHPVLKQITSEPGPQSLPAWLRFLSRTAKREVALRLEAAGYLQHIRGRIPWIQGQWIPVNQDWAFAPVLRVRAALDAARPLTTHGAALTGLAIACGLGFRVSQYRTQARRTVIDAIAVLDANLQDLIAQTQTAVDSAVLSHRA